MTTTTFGGLDRGASLTLAYKSGGGAGKGKPSMQLKNREVSARRQVGDAEDMVNRPTNSMDEKQVPWWKNVGMEEGL
jgi:hypothetical protein